MVITIHRFLCFTIFLGYVVKMKLIFSVVSFSLTSVLLFFSPVRPKEETAALSIDELGVFCIIVALVYGAFFSPVAGTFVNVISNANSPLNYSHLHLRNKGLEMVSNLLKVTELLSGGVLQI